MKGSIIIAVLESYEIVRRQVLWFSRWMRRYPDWELLIVDDGSDPEIPMVTDAAFRYQLVRTYDTRPWTQPCARNLGAQIARGEWLLMTDIDHIITEDAVRATNAAIDQDKIHFLRRPGVLDEEGALVTQPDVLVQYGCDPAATTRVDSHYNTFAIRANVFREMKGYDPKFCGKYGGDDTDFHRRYGTLHAEGRARRTPAATAGIYVYPDPRRDVRKVFHRLRG